MNVIMLGPFGLHPKGTMRARALPAARALAARGHTVSLVMPPWHTPADAGRAWVDPDSGVRIEYVTLAGLRWPLIGHLAVAQRMAGRALALRPDVVHAFKPKAYSGLAAALLRARQRLGTPLALVMDTDDWEGAGGWNEIEPYTRAQRQVFALQERWGLRHADAVTVASRALEALVWATGVPRDRVAYLPNALGPQGPRAAGAPLDGPVSREGASPGDGDWPQSDATAPRETESGARGTEAPAAGLGARVSDPARRPGPVLLLYTRFFEFDLERPLAVLRRTLATYPDARLLVVGRGLFGEERRFLARAGEMGIAHAVDYRGWVDEPELGPAFGAADVALYPFDDTLVNRTKSSVKLLELMAAGLPVVADAVGQNAEVVENGHSGVLVPPGDTGAFADAVAGLLSDPERRRTMGAAARSRVADVFNWPRQVAALEAVYARAVGLRGASRPV